LISIVPMIGLWIGFARLQKTYAIVGAAFMPMLAVALLWRNGNALGDMRNGPVTRGALCIILVFFTVLLGRQLI